MVRFTQTERELFIDGYCLLYHFITCFKYSSFSNAQARYTVEVCVCVCVDCYSCSRISEVQVRVSIGF